MTAEQILTAIDAGVVNGKRIEETVAELIEAVHGDAAALQATVTQQAATIATMAQTANVQAALIESLQTAVTALQAP
jgi:hypothetical protein